MPGTDGLLANFSVTTSQPSHSAFSSVQPWGTDSRLLGVLEIIDLEVNSGLLAVDSLSPRVAPLLHDLKAAHSDTPSDPEYIRLYLSFRMAMACVGCGRWSRAYEWLLCGLSDLPWEEQSAGGSTTADHFPGRLPWFFSDQRLIETGDARRTVLGWIGTLLYYSWKEGGLRELVEMAFDDVMPLLPWACTNLEGDEQDAAVDAMCHLVTWLSRNGRLTEAEAAVKHLEAVATSGDTSALAIKAICMQLSGTSSQYSTRASHEWAEMGLQHAELLVGHERLQLLVNRSIRADAAEAYQDIADAAAANAGEIGHEAPGTAAFNYAQARLFDVIRPFAGRLISEGRPDLVASLLGAWYRVSPDHQRAGPVFACSPASPDGPVFAEHQRVLSYKRGPDTFTEVFRIQNAALGASNTIADDASLVIQSPERAGVPVPSNAEEFEAALAAFYCLDDLAMDLEKQPPASATALLPIQSLCHPLQSLMLKYLGATWPISTSYEEPAPDRVLQHVVLWSAGTLGGEAELEAVSAIMQAAQVRVTKVVGDLNPSEFIGLYEDSQFDAVWINAHGEFSAPDPHAAHIVLSQDRNASISLAELAALSIPDCKRRLFFLNVCDGGNVMMTDAPPRLGVAPLLASRNQAVISHLWPARPFVATAFGTLMAYQLALGAKYFDAFQSALRSLLRDESGVLEEVSAITPRPDDLIERLSRGNHFRDSTLFDWGSPVFYE